MTRTAIRLLSDIVQGPIRDVAVRPADPVAACVMRARACRLAGDLDNAELWLNEACSVYRALGVKNTSRTYRIESRAVAWARTDACEPPDDEV